MTRKTKAYSIQQAGIRPTLIASLPKIHNKYSRRAASPDWQPLQTWEFIEFRKFGRGRYNRENNRPE
jgi:hypothetical protein